VSPALNVEVPPSGVLFDSDGVLVDSTACVERAWSAWARHYGLDEAAVLSKVHGHPSRETVAELLPAAEVAAALAHVDRLELESAGEVRALPGADDLLRSLPRTAWAVVTSGTGALARARLEAAGLPTPVHLVTADDVERGKPEPEPYLAGARALGRRAERCVVFEDAATGVAAARAAGAGVVVGVGEAARTLDVDTLVVDLSQVCYDGTLRVPDARATPPPAELPPARH
jgi:sugar-phosphatase